MKEISKLKKVILFLNASSYRWALAGHSKDSSFNQYHTIGSGINFAIEFMLFKLLKIKTDGFSSQLFTLILVSPLILHLAIDLLFARDLTQINENYNFYYGKYYYVTYCIVAIIAIGFGIYYLFH
jgi:spore coat protein CotH